MLCDSPALAEAFVAAHPEIEFVDAIFADLCGIIRGKRYPIEDLHKIMMKGITIPASVFLLSVTGSSHDPLGLGISDGDPDSLLVPIEGMLPGMVDSARSVLRNPRRGIAFISPMV